MSGEKTGSIGRITGGGKLPLKFLFGSSFFFLRKTCSISTLTKCLDQAATFHVAPFYSRVQKIQSFHHNCNIINPRLIKKSQS